MRAFILVQDVSIDLTNRNALLDPMFEPAIRETDVEMLLKLVELERRVWHLCR